MKTRLAWVALFAVAVVGCNSKEEELQKQLSQTESERATLQQNITERDKYFEDVMQTVNDIYTDLEKARVKEGKLVQRTEGVEGPAQFANADTRQKLLQNISDIGASLKENRKRIADLQTRVRSYHGQLAGLNTLIGNLKQTLLEREHSIADLESKVQGLEDTVAERSRTIAERDNVIDTQQKKINTGFYVVGTRDELKKKGILTDEGGFLWGLLGSTTVVAGGFDTSEFTPIDKTKDQMIAVQGKIDEVLPRRSPDAFATEQRDENHSEITIFSPDKFWKNNYLVIVTD